MAKVTPPGQDSNLTKHLLLAAADSGEAGVPQSIAAEYARPVMPARRHRYVAYIGRHVPYISKAFHYRSEAERLRDCCEEAGWVCVVRDYLLLESAPNPAPVCVVCEGKFDGNTDDEGVCGACQDRADAERDADDVWGDDGRNDVYIPENDYAPRRW